MIAFALYVVICAAALAASAYFADEKRFGPAVWMFGVFLFTLRSGPPCGW